MKKTNRLSWANLSDEEKKRLVDFVALLLEIDRKQKTKKNYIEKILQILKARQATI